MPMPAPVVMLREEPPADARFSARVHFSIRPRRARGPATLVFSSAHHAAAPGARAFSAAAAHSGSPPKERDCVAHALVAAPLASGDRGQCHFRDGGTGAESAARGNGA